MFEVTNTNPDIVFINKVIDLFGRSPTSLEFKVESTLLNRFTTTISGNRDGVWEINEESVYPGDNSPARKYRYIDGKWYKLEDEEFEEIN